MPLGRGARALAALQIFVSAKNALLVKTLIDLAGELGYRVAAEGIETAEVLEQIKAWGCAEAQGFYLARPMASSDFERWYAEAR